MVYSPYAIDYSEGVDIYDPDTGQYLTESEARSRCATTRKRLIMKPRKIGCFVKDI